MNTFRKWVEAQGGIARAAQLIGVTRQTVYNWDKGEHAPTMHTMNYIIQISDNKVTLRDLRALSKKVDGRKAARNA